MIISSFLARKRSVPCWWLGCFEHHRFVHLERRLVGTQRTELWPRGTRKLEHGVWCVSIKPPKKRSTKGQINIRCGPIAVAIWFGQFFRALKQNFFHSYPCQHGRFIKVDDDNWINNTTFCAGKDSKCEKDEAGNDKYYDTLPKIYIPGLVTNILSALIIKSKGPQPRLMHCLRNFRVKTTVRQKMMSQDTVWRNKQLSQTLIVCFMPRMYFTRMILLS